MSESQRSLHCRHRAHAFPFMLTVECFCLRDSIVFSESRGTIDNGVVHPQTKLLTEKREGNLEMSESGKRGQLRRPGTRYGVAGSRGHGGTATKKRGTDRWSAVKGGEGRGGATGDP